MRNLSLLITDTCRGEPFFFKIRQDERQQDNGKLERQFDLIRQMGIANYIQLQSKPADEEGASTGD